MTLRRDALRIILLRDPSAKADACRGLSPSQAAGALDDIAEPAGVPGRPERPPLVPHTELKPRSVKTVEGRAALLHAIAHIERNAIDLALDIVWRFPAMPDEFYSQWASVAQEEALHFRLLRDHLHTLGFEYGDFPAHNALWEMAEKTKSDLLARLALVPRTLEARGLDASPPIKAKLLSVGDTAGAAILDVILRDEIGHVAVGNRWYRQLCAQRGLDPVQAYAELARRYGAPRLRPPFNREARAAAGFTEAEIASLDDKNE